MNRTAHTLTLGNNGGWEYRTFLPACRRNEPGYLVSLANKGGIYISLYNRKFGSIHRRVSTFEQFKGEGTRVVP